MRVVDQHGERLPLVDGLEPAGHAGERLHAGGDLVLVHIEQDPRRDGAEHVFDVEAAAQRALDRDPAGAEADPGAVEHELFGPDLGVVGEAEGDQRRTACLLELVGELPAPGVADVHCRRRRRRTGEEPPLRHVVLLHRAVEVEMVLRQVREHERVEADAVEAMQHRRVRGRLERDAAVARVEHLAKRPLQIDRLGRGAHDRPNLSSDPALDGAEQAGPAARRFQDRVQQVRGGRLAVRAGDTGDLELARRLAEEHVRRGRHRSARGRHHELGNLRLDRPLDDEDDGAVLDRLTGEVVAVRVLAGDAEERRTGGDGARVVREVSHLDGVGAAEDRLRCERCNEALELHWRQQRYRQ